MMACGERFRRARYNRMHRSVMPATSSVELGSVQKTLLLPLWGRSVETTSAHPLLVDETAVRIIASLGYDFSTIASHISPITQLSWIARSLHIDRTVREFLSHHPDATVVNLGCGLDTTFERVDNGQLIWYDLDLADVIKLRRRFIPESDRRIFLACSLFDQAWRWQLKADHSVFFIAAGVLYYFQESQIRALFSSLADAFPGSELIFDATTARGVKMANQKVIAAGGMDESAILRWGLERARDLQTWDAPITVLDHYPIFRNLKQGLEFKKQWGMLMADSLRVLSMVHVRLGRSCAP